MTDSHRTANTYRTRPGYSTIVDTPVGPFTMVVTADGAVRAAGFTTDLQSILGPADLVEPPAPRPELGQLTRAVAAYLEGDVTAIDEVPVEQPHRGEFIATAWRALRDIKPGAPITYTELAARSGRPAAVRAAASACARNDAALFLPCHRVLRGDGGLGGYRWGVAVKQWLLQHERPA